MFYKRAEEGYRETVSGSWVKMLTYGDKTLTVEFRLLKGHELPRHSHPHEQTGYLVSGHIRMTIDHDVFDVHPGDCWTVLGNVEHQVDILEDSIAVEAFSPVREDYLPRREE